MVYSLDSDETPYTAPVKNRFTGDWVALHMMSTICRLTGQRNASYNFLKNGGMAFAQNLKELRASDLTLAARVVEPTRGDSLQQVLKNDAVPRKVKACFEAMQAASANVVGTDGHRRHCRHEGWAYMEMFGPPLIFLTPNIADTQHPLLLVIQGETVDLGGVAADMPGTLPKYRDMIHRLAQDPVTLHDTPLHSTTLQLELHNYTPLHSTTLHYTTLHYLALHFTTLNYITLHYTTTTTTTTLHFTPLHSTTLKYTTLHYITLHSATLHYTTLHYTTLHSATLHYTTLHYTTLHYTE